MDVDGRLAFPKEFSNAHDCAARADASHKSLRPFADRKKLRPDFRAGGFSVGLNIGRIGKLPREKNVAAAGGEFFAAANAAEEAALVFADRNHFGAIAADEMDAFLAHPVRHKDFDGMAQHAADSGEGDPCVAAGSFGDGVTGSNFSLSVGLLENTQSYAVLDAAGEVQILRLGMKHAVLALITEMNRKQRSVANQARKSLEFGGGHIGKGGHGVLFVA